MVPRGVNNASFSAQVEIKAYFPLDEKFARREIFIPMGMRNKIIMQ